MIEKDISIQDNFLVEEEFTTLRDAIIDKDIPWYFSPTITTVDVESTPGYFFHMIYDKRGPYSTLYESHFQPLINQLDCALVAHVRINLNPRLPERYVNRFHHDLDGILENRIIKEFTTSVLHINTNNGYTEFKDGTKVESVANRLVSWPSNTEHRVVTQTDKQRRILINLNYLKEAQNKRKEVFIADT